MKSHNNLSKEKRLEIQKLYKEGHSFVEIGRILDCDQHTAALWAKRDNVNEKPRKNDGYKKRWGNTHSHETLILKLYKETPSSRKVREKLLERGIKMSIVTILKKIPDELKSK